LHFVSPGVKDILFIQKHNLHKKICVAVIILHFHFQCEQTNNFYLNLETGCIASGLDMVLDGISLYIFLYLYFIYPLLFYRERVEGPHKQEDSVVVEQT